MNNNVFNNEKSAHKLMFLSVLFVACLLAANITAVKLFSSGITLFNGHELIMTAGILMYPITFLFMDTITEVWGRKTAQLVIWSGFISNLLVIGVIQITIQLPPAGFWPDQQAYESILGSVPRMVFASLAAYLVSQSLDITVFSWLKKKTEGKHLWMRSNISTMLSQLVDSHVFMFVAFLGIMSIPDIFTAMYSEYLIKMGYALFGTPFVYLLVKWARSQWKSKSQQVAS